MRDLLVKLIEALQFLVPAVEEETEVLASVSDSRVIEQEEIPVTRSRKKKE